MIAAEPGVEGDDHRVGSENWGGLQKLRDNDSDRGERRFVAAIRVAVNFSTTPPPICSSTMTNFSIEPLSDLLANQIFG
jgi:hypothetical protein